ncbi:hypothetical protein FQZ97_847830 [compost metagenome]
MDGVHHLPGKVDECRLGGCAGRGKGIHLQASLERLYARRRIAVLHEGAAKQQVPKSGRVHDEVALSRQFALVAWWHEQILAALALVGPGIAQVCYVAEPEIVDHAKNIGWRFHHDWTVLQVHPVPEINGLGIGGQE